VQRKEERTGFFCLVRTEAKGVVEACSPEQRRDGLEGEGERKEEERERERGSTMMRRRSRGGRRGGRGEEDERANNV
jgi:hypothetical protein